MLLTVCACASPPRMEPLTFEELYGDASRSAESIPRRGARLPVPGSPAELDAVLTLFVERATAYRQAVAKGGAMPAAQVENWDELNRALEVYLSRPLGRDDVPGVTRAQSVLETQLEQDGRTYGDMPGALADAVVMRVGRLALIMAALHHPGRPSGTDGLPRFAWPVSPVSITSLFGYRWHPITGQHRRHLGLDLAARPGQAIYTAEKGVVLRAGWNGDHGNQVEVQHTGGWLTRYSHLSEVLVAPGEILERGDALGLAGETGLATGVHLHFELWRDGEPLDPLDALGGDEPSPREDPPMAWGGGTTGPATHQGRRPVGQRP
jgi:murein DD-endopeptidase MepM/ murein hydrolase activator NlpD